MGYIQRPFTFDRVIRLIIGIAVIVFLFYALDQVSAAILPFLIGWLIAYLLNPLVCFFRNRLRIKKRPLAIFLAILTVVLFLGTLVVLLIPPIQAEIESVRVLMLQIKENGGYLPFLPLEWQTFLAEQIDWDRLFALISNEDWKRIIEATVPSVWGALSGSLNFLFGIGVLFITLLYAIFILVDYDSITEGTGHLIPLRYRNKALQLMRDVEDSMNRYFRGQALVAFIVGVLMSIGFWIVDIPMGIVLGLFIGVLNMVPYLQTLGFVPGTILCLIRAAETGGDFWIIFGLMTLVILIVQIIQDTVIVPRVMGKVTGMNPAVILLSLSIWGSLLGMVGMIIALPMTSLLLSYYKRFIVQDKEEE